MAVPDLFHPASESLGSLLQEIDEGKLVLPAFQRRWVWDVSRQEALLRSIVNSYPAGSLLFLEHPPDEKTLGKKLIDGVDPSRESVYPTRIILDGQQRLTTLYHMLYGTGGRWTRRALVDIKKARIFLNADGKLPESVTEAGQLLVRTSLIFTPAEWVQRDYGLLEQQFKAEVLPLSCIFAKEEFQTKEGSKEYVNISDWKHMFAEYWAPNDSNQRRALRKELDEVERRFAAPIREYRFPVIVLTRNTEPQAVCQVFVDLNIQQKPLDSFEVVAARVWPFGVNLYKKWEQSLATYPSLRYYEIDEVIPLQIISLIQTWERRQTDPQVPVRCTKAALYEIEPKGFGNLWDMVTSSLAWCLGLLKGEAGVLTAKWLPFPALLVAMAATRVSNVLLARLPDAEVKPKLLRWFWCSVFAARYASGTNSQNAWDFQELIRWMVGGSPPYTVTAFSSLFNPDASVLRTETYSRSGRYQGVICLLLRQHAKDYQTKQEISTNIILQEQIDDHHIFPESYLTSQGVEWAKVNCILNRALIDASTNKSIGARPPSVYLNNIRKERGEEWMTEVLESQLQPTEPNSALFRDDFEGFLRERQDMIAKEIAKVTG